MEAFGETVNFIWEVADVLRGDFKAPDYETVVLPFTVLRRFDCVLEASKPAVLAAADRCVGADPDTRHAMLLAAAGAPVYNHSPDDLGRLAALDRDALPRRLRAYIAAFDPDARHVLARFGLDETIGVLAKKRLLAPVVRRFAAFGLYPPGRAPAGRRAVDNHEMGYIFEELIRKFKEQSGETAGEHFTPREVVRLIVDLLFCESPPRPGATLYDPACGTGGMLAAAEERARERALEDPGLPRPDEAPPLRVYGQEINDASYAIALADAMLRGRDPLSVAHGNSLTADLFPEAKFDYCVCNPPYGVSWKKVRAALKEEARHGKGGRFAAGLPRVSDGSLLFLQHMLSKTRRPRDGGSRIAVIFAGSPLFTGAPGTGESEIRRWIIENDWLEAVIALPPGLFYNTAIRTYVWLLCNRKRPRRQRRIQLIDATALCERMPRSLGDKRHRMTPAHIAEVVRLYRAFAPGERVRIFDDDAFAFRRVTIERPLRLRFCVDAAAIGRVRALSTFGRLEDDADGRALQRAILEALASIGSERVFRDRAAFVPVLEAALRRFGAKTTARLRKAIGLAIGERDPEAAPCLARDGLPEPDPQLRDTEDVPLEGSIGAFMAREVLPYVPDAWTEPEKARVGYQIPFDRVFHTWTEPRPVSEIEAELRALEAESAALLAEILPCTGERC